MPVSSHPNRRDEPEPEVHQADCAALHMAYQELDGRVLKAAYEGLCVQRSWPTITDLVSRYGSWNNALRRCGVPLPRKHETPVEECYEAFMAVATDLDRSPSALEYDARREKCMPCSNTVRAKYGGWPVA